VQVSANLDLLGFHTIEAEYGADLAGQLLHPIAVESRVRVPDAEQAQERVGLPRHRTELMIYLNLL